jgi:adenylate kinase
MRLVIIGPPGAGKGTQAELLSRELAVPHFSTGDILREARRAETELGRRAQTYMDAGELVPDDVILRIMDEALQHSGGFLLDGFPRTVAQAEGLHRILAARDQRLDAVINLAVADEELVRRLSSRRICEDCGAVAQAIDRPASGVCSQCGGKLVQRPDDGPETIRRRLEVYRSQTEPVLRWYRGSDVPVLDIDGLGGVEDVQRRVAHRLEH